jgi:restriction system protein
MIPDFQTLMLPILKHIKDGKEYSTTEILKILEVEFNLTQSELEEYLPSGVQKTFHNRVFWAKAYLKMAGLIENIKRGVFKITQDGLAVLKDNPQKIDIKYLKQFPVFIENRKPKSDNGNEVDVDDEKENVSTPEEILESNYLKIRKNLSLELLNKVKSCSPSFFENLVVELLVKMGYGGSIKEAGKSIGKTGDEGIDGIIKEDKLGLDVIYIQAKRWEGVVGRPEIQKFVGALAGQGAKKGVFITTSRFSNDAKEYQPRIETKIVLIDGEQLADLMIDYDLAVSTSSIYTIKRIDNDYFEELN